MDLYTQHQVIMVKRSDKQAKLNYYGIKTSTMIDSE